MILQYSNTPATCGLAMGITTEDLAFDELRVKPSKILKQLTIGANKK
jgi:hypothetical protein